MSFDPNLFNDAYIPSSPFMWGAAGLLGLLTLRLAVRLAMPKGGKSDGALGCLADLGKASPAAGSGDASTESESDREQEQERQLEKTEQEKLKELFELFDDGKEKPSELQQEQERQDEQEREKDELGENKEAVKGLHEQAEKLIDEILALTNKGLSGQALAKALTSRCAADIPPMELQPMIDAMEAFLKKNDAKTAVIGMNADFERKGALSALLRGDYENACDYLSRRANDADKRAEATHRGDVKRDALHESAALHRAIAVLTRPHDPERSFAELKESDEREPDNALTIAMMGRAYAESGKTDKAAATFDKAAEIGEKDDYAAQYAAEQAEAIRFQAVAVQAARIRENYENLLGADTVRQTEQFRIRQDFVRDELLDRSNEHNIE